MKSVAVGVLFAIVAGTPAVTGGRAQDPQFRAGVHSVSVYATVSDAQGRLVPNLTQADFAIFDDGEPKLITQFDNAIQPVTVVMMLDRSSSVEGNFDLERAGAEHFVADLTDADRARVGSFNGLIQIDPVGFTSDRDELIRILHLNLLDVGLTPLWNATSAAMDALAREHGRRVVMLFTDGYDNPGLPDPRINLTFGEVRDRSRADGIMVYGVGLASSCVPPDPKRSPGRPSDQQASPPRPTPGTPGGGAPTPPLPGSPLSPRGRGPLGPGINMPTDRVAGGHKWDRCSGAAPNPELKEMASDSGGGFVDLRPNADLAATFSRVSDELHHQYLLGLTTTKLDGRIHRLDVRVRDPSMTVRARRTYVATPGGDAVH
jgi:VWFA-related protein